MFQKYKFAILAAVIPFAASVAAHFVPSLSNEIAGLSVALAGIVGKMAHDADPVAK